MIKSKGRTGLYIRKGWKIRFRTKKGYILNVNRVLLCLAILILATVIIIGLLNDNPRYKQKSITYVSKVEISDNNMIEEIDIKIDNEKVEDKELVTTDNVEQTESAVINEVEPASIEEPERLNYRLTSYYSGDGTGSGVRTASGKGTDEFQINNKGWYTYQGKLVVATASKRLLSWSQYSNSNQRFFNLYDELILIIDGVEYEAIVLDVCGAAMKRPIIDLFVSNKSSVKDAQIQVIIK